MRAFERGARHDHRPNIRLKLGSSQVFHGMEDSTKAFAGENSEKTDSVFRVGVCDSKTVHSKWSRAILDN